MKPIEFHLDKKNQKTDFKTRYIKFRLGRIKHQLWLNNRKSEHKVLYEEDKKILDCIIILAMIIHIINVIMIFY